MEENLAKGFMIMKNKYISSIWNFDIKNEDIEKNTYHNYLRWYGKLPPQLVEKLLKLYSHKGDKILANFSGSGTVPLECFHRWR